MKALNRFIAKMFSNQLTGVSMVKRLLAGLSNFPTCCASNCTRSKHLQLKIILHFQVEKEEDQFRKITFLLLDCLPLSAFGLHPHKLQQKVIALEKHSLDYYSSREILRNETGNTSTQAYAAYDWN